MKTFAIVICALNLLGMGLMAYQGNIVLTIFNGVVGGYLLLQLRSGAYN